jgi:cytochrome c556
MLKNSYYFIIILICLSNISVVYAEPKPFEKLEFHVVYSEKLRDIMQRMNQLVYKKELPQLERKDLRTQHLEDMVYTVNELGFAAIVLREALPGFDLNTEEKDIFHAITIQLQNEAENIKKMAEENDIANMERSYKRLNDTCSACHELFRF